MCVFDDEKSVIFNEKEWHWMWQRIKARLQTEMEGICGLHPLKIKAF